MAADDPKADGTKDEAKDAGTVKSKTPPTTIDLKASEIKDETPPPKPEEKAAKTESKPSTSTTRPAASKPATGRTSATGSRPSSASKADKSASSVSSDPARSSAATPPPQAASSSSSSGIFAALFGGVIGAGLIYGLIYFGLLPVADQSDNTAIEAEIAALKESVSGFSTEPVDLSPVETEISALSETVSTLSAQVEAVSSEGSTAAVDLAPVESSLETLQTTVTDLTARLDGITSNAESGVVDLSPLESEIAGLKTSLGEMQTALADAPSGVDASALEPLMGRLDTIETAVANRPSFDPSALETSISEVTGTVETLAARVGASEDRLGVVEDGIASNASALEAVNAGMADLQSAAQTFDSERQAAYLVALSGLQRAASGSGPFETELSAAIAMAGDDSPLSGLSDFAKSGIPSTSDLTTAFAEIDGAILDRAAKASADGVFGRIAAGAQSLVRVRPVGFVDGDSPAAIVARIEALLAEGKLKAAVEEWESLPEAGKDVSSDWAAMARQRLALEAALSGATAVN